LQAERTPKIRGVINTIAGGLLVGAHQPQPEKTPTSGTGSERNSKAYPAEDIVDHIHQCGLQGN